MKNRSTESLGARIAARRTAWLQNELNSLLETRADLYERDLATLSRGVDEMVLPTPPSEVRYRVVNRPETRLEHLRIGLAIRDSLADALSDLGTSFDDYSSILDWGCGCSRVLRHLRYLSREGVRLSGFDIDAVTVGWSSRNIEDVSFAVNGAAPPLPAEDESFDLVFAASVFSHLEEDRQTSWLPELNRVMMPGGVLMLSTHGQTAMDASRSSIPDSNQREFDERGFTFIENIADGVLPDWYQTSFQSEQHARTLFGKTFAVEGFYPAGMVGYQDLVVCRKS